MLAQQWTDDPTVKQFFHRECTFSNSQLVRFDKYLRNAATTLRSRKESGALPLLKSLADSPDLFVADYAKLSRASQSQKEVFSAAHSGFIGQNVYLYCASEGLATGVRAGMDRPALAKALKLRPDQKIILAQTIGLPRK